MTGTEDHGGLIPNPKDRVGLIPESENRGTSSRRPSPTIDQADLTSPVSYTRPPSLVSDPSANHRTRRWKPWLITGGLLAAAGALAFSLTGPQIAEIVQPATVLTAQQEGRTLQLGAAEIDREATEYARQLIAANAASGRGLGSSAEEPNEAKPITMAPVVLPEGQAQAPAPNAPKASTPGNAAAKTARAEPAKSPTLSAARKEAVRNLVRNAPKKDLQRIAAGRQVIYKVQLIDSEAEDGDQVSLSVNGAGYGIIPLMHAGAELMITLPENAQARIKVVAVADGGGGVTFGARTSDGVIRSRVMEVGESDSWIVTAR